MSDESKSSETSTAAATKPEKKPRSPVERAIVWGAIAVLLVIIAVQAFAYYGFAASQDYISSEMAKLEEGKSDEEPTLSNIEKSLTGWWKRSEIKDNAPYQYVIYRWPGVFSDYRILLNLGADEEEQLVLSYETNTDKPGHQELLAELAAERARKAEGDTEGEEVEGEGGGPPGGMGMAAGGGPGTGAGHAGFGGGGGGPGGGRFDPFENDANEDGKLSREETPERMRQFFDRMDENSDGFIDEQEWEAALERRRAAQRQAGEENDGEGAPDESGEPEDEADTQDDQPPQEETAETPDSDN